MAWSRTRLTSFLTGLASAISLELVEVDALAAALELGQVVVAGELADEVTDARRRVLGVVAAEGLGHVVFVGDAGDDVEAHQGLEVVGSVEVIGVGEGDAEGVGLAVVFGRDDAVGVGRLGRDHVDDVFLDVDISELDRGHADLGRQGRLTSSCST
jgi:hypothetical protein